MRNKLNLKLVLILLALAVITVPVSADVGAERVLSATTITPGSNLEVTINVADYGDGGQVLEKIPVGFTFVSTTFPNYELVKGDNGDVLSFILLDETRITYTTKAPVSTSQGKFLGLLRYNKTDSFAIPDSIVTVKKSSTHSSGGGSSGGGGGGGGGSPEAQSNVEVKELSQAFVSNGNHVRFEFPKGVTCIKYVEFDAKKTAGKITTIAEILKKKSGLVSNLPAGTVYKNVNIWVGNSGTSDSKNIDNPAVGFSVEKTWLEENGADAADVSIWRYEDGWSELESRKIEEDDTFVYIEADTPGFESFVILLDGVASAESTPISKEILPLDSSSGPESEPASEPQKHLPSSEDKSESGLPGFCSLFALGTLGATYCMLRRKP